jgi:hypothetical protein
MVKLDIAGLKNAHGGRSAAWLAEAGRDAVAAKATARRSVTVQ